MLSAAISSLPQRTRGPALSLVLGVVGFNSRARLFDSRFCRLTTTQVGGAVESKRCARLSYPHAMCTHARLLTVHVPTAACVGACTVAAVPTAAIFGGHSRRRCYTHPLITRSRAVPSSRRVSAGALWTKIAAAAAAAGARRSSRLSSSSRSSSSRSRSRKLQQPQPLQRRSHQLAARRSRRSLSGSAAP